MRLRSFFIFLVFSLFTISCIKDFDRPAWEIDALSPILKTSLSVRDVIQDSILKVGEGDSLFFVFTENLIPFDLDTFLQLDTKPFIRNLKLDSIVMDDQNIHQESTLESILQSAVDGGQLPGMPADGSLFLIPALPGIEVGPFTVDGSEYFQSITLLEGVMEISIKNDFPSGISNIFYTIVNTVSGDTIESGTFPDMPVGASNTDTINLAGKTIEGHLDINFSADIDGTGFIFLDYSDAIVTDLTLRDMRIYSATAIFPAQTLLNHEETVPLLDMEDMEITQASISHGNLRVRVASTLEEESYHTYYIPKATYHGESFFEEITMPAADPGSSRNEEFLYDFDDYEFDFTGPDDDSVNCFYNQFIGRIDSTGNMVFLTLEDSLDIIVEVLDMTPSVIRGYLGQQVFDPGIDTIGFDVFDEFKIDSLNLNGVQLSLRVDNYLGMDGEVNISSVTAINTNSGKSASLDVSSLGLPFYINKATDNGLEAVPAVEHIQINDENSNPSELISVLPNMFIYKIDVVTNPSGNTGLYDQFAYADQTINAFLDVKIPITLKSSGLVLLDTIAMDISETEQLDDIKEGVIKFYISNGFPVEVDLKFDFLNEGDSLIDSFIPTEVVQASVLDNLTGKVSEVSVSEISYVLTEDMVQSVLSANKVFISATLNTKPDGDFVHLFDDYRLDVRAVGDFIYKLKK